MIKSTTPSYNQNLLIQENPNDYRNLALAMSMQNRQQPQQSQGMSMPQGMGIADKFIPGGEASGAEGGGDGLQSVASNPYAWLAAVLSWKAYDTKKRSGVGFKEQLRNISKAPGSDADRWQLEKYMPWGGKDVYTSSHELASGDVSNWWKKANAPWKYLRDKI